MQQINPTSPPFAGGGTLYRNLFRLLILRSIPDLAASPFPEERSLSVICPESPGAVMLVKVTDFQEETKRRGESTFAPAEAASADAEPFGIAEPPSFPSAPAPHPPRLSPPPIPLLNS